MNRTYEVFVKEGRYEENNDHCAEFAETSQNSMRVALTVDCKLFQ